MFSTTHTGAYQNSEKISFGFLGLGYDPTLNDTYDIALTVGDLTDTIDVQVGSGFTAAVPEPSTWAMMALLLLRWFHDLSTQAERIGATYGLIPRNPFQATERPPSGGLFV